MGGGNVRGEQRHVGPADGRVRDFCVERRNCDEHDSVSERREHVLADNEEKVPGGCAVSGEDGHDELGECRRSQAPDKGPAPDVHRRIRLAPLSDVVPERHLDGEVDQDREGEVLLAEALVEQLQTGDGIVGLEPDLGNQVDNDECLDVLELEDAPHDAVDLHDALPFLGPLLSLQHCQAQGNEQVRPAPERKVAVQSHEPRVQRSIGRAEPLVGKVLGVEREKYGMRKEMPGSQTHRLRGRRIREVLVRKQRQSPP